MNLLKGSAFLKFVALIVALLTYSYIRNEIENKDRNRVDPSYKLIKLTAKNLPVKVRLDAARPSGFRVAEDQILVTPAMVTVIGPEALLEEAENTETSILDVGEYTKTVTKQVPLESVAGVHVGGEPMLVTVTVPVERLPAPQEPAPALAPPAPPAEPAPASTA